MTAFVYPNVSTGCHTKMLCVTIVEVNDITLSTLMPDNMAGEKKSYIRLDFTNKDCIFLAYKDSETANNAFNELHERMNLPNGSVEKLAITINDLLSSLEVKHL